MNKLYKIEFVDETIHYFKLDQDNDCIEFYDKDGMFVERRFLSTQYVQKPTTVKLNRIVEEINDKLTELSHSIKEFNND